MHSRLAIRNAFKHWSEVTPLTFTETSQNPDLEIRFEKERLHGDGYPFRSNSMSTHDFLFFEALKVDLKMV